MEGGEGKGMSKWGPSKTLGVELLCVCARSNFECGGHGMRTHVCARVKDFTCTKLIRMAYVFVHTRLYVRKWLNACTCPVRFACVCVSNHKRV